MGKNILDVREREVARQGLLFGLLWLRRRGQWGSESGSIKTLVKIYLTHPVFWGNLYHVLNRCDIAMRPIRKDVLWSFV